MIELLTAIGAILNIVSSTTGLLKRGSEYYAPTTLEIMEVKTYFTELRGHLEEIKGLTKKGEAVDANKFIEIITDLLVLVNQFIQKINRILLINDSQRSLSMHDELFGSGYSVKKFVSPRFFFKDLPQIKDENDIDLVIKDLSSIETQLDKASLSPLWEKSEYESSIILPYRDELRVKKISDFGLPMTNVYQLSQIDPFNFSKRASLSLPLAKKLVKYGESASYGWR